MKHKNLFALLGLDLPHIELEFLPFQNVTVSASNLSRSAGNTGCNANTKEVSY